MVGLQWKTCLVYLDDIIVFGSSFEQHLSRLGEVLSKFKEANLKVKPSKCNLFSTVWGLRHIISKKGVATDPQTIEAVRAGPVPKNDTEVQSFLRLASYYRQVVAGFADVECPSHHITEKGHFLFFFFFF